MISYKYKLYQTKKTKHIDMMMIEACQVWNHALSLQRRYYRRYKSYIPCNRIQHHFAKRFKRTYLHARMVQAILQRLDSSYKRFFDKIAKRPPKYKKNKSFSLIFRRKKDKYLDGCKIVGDVFTINKCNKSFRFFCSRPYLGNILFVSITRNWYGDYFVSITTDAIPNTYGKTHNGASIGIDFGVKTYLTLSDGTKINAPMFLEKSLDEYRSISKSLAKSKKGSKNKERKIKKLAALNRDIENRRNDFQWKLAHHLCKNFDYIFIEDLNLNGMRNLKRCKRKLVDLSHAAFVEKLILVAKKYNVIVHKIDRFYPSSKTCECGYINKELKLSDRRWVCPKCGTIHDRDVLAANNILRRGIYELESNNKTKELSA